MQNFCVARYSESLLDCRSFTKKRSSSSWALPTLRSGGGNHSTHPHLMCFCKAILVCHVAAHKLESVDTHKEWILLTGGNMLTGDFLTSTGRVLTPCVLGAWILWKHRNACVFELWKSFSKPAGGGASLQGVPAVAILGGQKAYCPKPRDECGEGLVDGRVVVWSYVSCFYVIVFYSRSLRSSV